MRMASALSTLLVVLCGAVAGAGDVIGNVSRVRRAPQPHFSHHGLPEEEDMTAAWRRSHWRSMQTIIRTEGSQPDHMDGVECCPTVVEMVRKTGGRTSLGLYVELFEGPQDKQKLYEVSCAEGVVDQPCRFVDSRLYNNSRCIQKYSYSYALVRHIHSAATEKPQQKSDGHISVPGSGGWSLDYVLVRSGCECQIKPGALVGGKSQTRSGGLPGSKSQTKTGGLPGSKSRRRHKQKKRNRRIVEVDET